MYNFSEEAKQRIKNGKVVRAYLKVLATDEEEEFIINEENYLKDFEFADERWVENEGFIGQAVAKSVTGNFNNIASDFNIEDREFELYMGVDLEDGTTEYHKYGTFIVQRPTDDQVNDNTSFEALDYMIKFNSEFKESEIVKKYPYSLKELFQWVVESEGMQIKENDFLNQDYQVFVNPFAEGTTKREVLKAISQVAFSWVRVDEENRVAIDFDKDTESIEEIDANDYFTYEKNPNAYGPLNYITFKMSQVKGSEVPLPDPESIARYGITELDIIDNPFANENYKREELIQAGENLFGLMYIPLKMDLIGLIYLNCNDKIIKRGIDSNAFDKIILDYVFDKKEEGFATYIFNHTIKYNGIALDTIETEVMTNTETKYKYTSPVKSALRRTEIIVDKANQQIQSIVEEIGDREHKLTTITQDLDRIESKVSDLVDLTNIATGTKRIKISDAYPDERILELHIYGNNSVFDYLYPDDTLYPDNTLYPYGDSRIRFYNDEEDRTIDLGITEVLRANEEVRDEIFVNGTQVTLIRRVEPNGVTKVQPEITELGSLEFILREKDNYFEIVNYEAPIEIKYAIASAYTDIFATKVEMSSSITQTANEINLRVNQKVDEKDYTAAQIMLRINEDESEAQIKADKINLQGKEINLTGDDIIIKSRNFNVDQMGNMACNNASISGDLYNYSSNGDLAIRIHNTVMTFYDYGADKDVVGEISSTRTGGTGTKGISFYTVRGGKISLGYLKDPQGTTITSIINFDTNNPQEPPYIANTVSGTILPNANEGIKVKNGLITGWSLNGLTGQVSWADLNGDIYSLTISSGLITNIDIVPG